MLQYDHSLKHIIFHIRKEDIKMKKITFTAKNTTFNTLSRGMAILPAGIF